MEIYLILDGFPVRFREWRSTCLTPMNGCDWKNSGGSRWRANWRNQNSRIIVRLQEIPIKILQRRKKNAVQVRRKRKRVQVYSFATQVPANLKGCFWKHGGATWNGGFRRHSVSDDFLPKVFYLIVLDNQGKYLKGNLVHSQNVINQKI